ncbi:hypothetical protein PAXRUDRAFT_147816 [Paxillus rubicundulus Ve08.2h10]|uniref:DUF6534 domain-containing protein n=1 Tax=Paxillus rubicundulus Ve08.2h10 TaxID=930991 RepID=A0A0D0E4K0_9AGAM|nr:hypothetical protein PAXRUDRAFT_147816 [Paxillus rubicundulus Ve08.2h10]
MSPQSVLAVSLARGPLVGTFLGLFLYGITCLQAFFYFQTYERDHRGLKITVMLMSCRCRTLETVHAALSIWVMDDYLIVHYADEGSLQSANWSVSRSTYILGFMIDFFVYLYFTWRIWIFTGNKWIVVLMLSISISRTAISLIACILSVISPTWTRYLSHARTLIIIGNVLFIIGDTFSASVMAYHLTSFRPRTDTYNTNSPRRINILINRLLIFAVATGALTSLVDIIALILSLTQPQSLAFMSPILVQTRLYANSLLTSLNIRNANSRAYIDAHDTSESADIEMQGRSLRFANPPNLSVISERSGRHQAIDPRKSTAESWHTAQDNGTSS